MLRYCGLRKPSYFMLRMLSVDLEEKLWRMEDDTRWVLQVDAVGGGC